MFIEKYTTEYILKFKSVKDLVYDLLPGNYIPNKEQAEEIVNEIVRTTIIWYKHKRNDNQSLNLTL